LLAVWPGPVRGNAVDAFRKDVYTQRDQLHGAVLVVLHGRVPHVVGACRMDAIRLHTRDIPLAFVTSPTPSTVQFALDAVLHAGQRTPRDSDVSDTLTTREHAALKLHFPRLDETMRARGASLDARVEALRDALAEAVQERDEHRSALYELHKLQTAVPCLATEDDATRLEIALDVYRTVQAAGETPRTSAMTTVQREAIRQAGGLKRVAKAAALRCARTAAGSVEPAAPPASPTTPVPAS
jgi:hypothetical protein